MEINRHQHSYIQNLQKANVFLKTRITELEKDNTEIKAKLNLKDDEKIPYTSEPNPAVVSEDFRLIPVGTIERKVRRQGSPVKQQSCD